MAIWGTIEIGTKLDKTAIHSDDFEKVRLSRIENPYRFSQTIFKCEHYSNDSEFITISDYFGEFRIKNKLFLKLSKSPVFDFGQTVKLKNKPEKIRIILLIAEHRHSKIDNIVYHVDVENGDYGRYYWFANQLEAILEG